MDQINKITFTDLSYNEVMNLDGGYDMWVYFLNGSIVNCHEVVYDFVQGVMDGFTYCQGREKYDHYSIEFRQTPTILDTLLGVAYDFWIVYNMI